MTNAAFYVAAGMMVVIPLSVLLVWAVGRARAERARASLRRRSRS